MTRAIIAAAAGLQGESYLKKFYEWGSMEPRPYKDFNVSALQPSAYYNPDGSGNGVATGVSEVLTTKSNTDLGAIYWTQVWAPVMFSSDGTKFLGIARSTGTLIGGTLSTAWDLSTLTFTSVNSGAFSSLGTIIVGFWTNDGQNLYVHQSGQVYNKYTLATAYDASSTLTFVHSITSGTDWGAAVTSHGFTWFNNGSDMYIVGTSFIRHITFTTPYDLTTGTYNSSTGSYSPNPTLSGYTSISCNSDGTKIMVWASDSTTDNGRVYHLELTSGGDFSTVTSQRYREQVRYISGDPIGGSNPPNTSYGMTTFRGTSGTSAADSARRFISTSASTGILKEWVMGGFTGDYNSSEGLQNGYTSGCAISYDGSHWFRTHAAQDKIAQYDLATNNEISTAVYNQLSAVAVPSGQPGGFDFNPDGTRLYTYDRTTDKVYQYNLSTGFDVSTMSDPSIVLDTSAITATRAGLAICDSGSKLLVSTWSSRTVRVYNLGTAYSLSGASLDSTNLLNTGISVSSVAITEDGTKIYCLLATGAIEQYTIETPFDLTTATLDGTLYIMGTNSNWKAGGENCDDWFDMSVTPDGSRLYVTNYDGGDGLQITIRGE